MSEEHRNGLWLSESCRRVATGLGFQAFALVILTASSTLHAGFEDRVFTDDDGDHRYSVFVPEDYTSDRKWPVILFLHGAGERGSDGRKQLTVGLAPVIRKRQETFPFIAVFPQCETTDARYLTGWLAGRPDAIRALTILENVEDEFAVDTDKRILTGWSMGGYGTWSIAAAHPDKWSAILPLAGGGEPEMAAQLAPLNVWAFHGSQDAAIRPARSRRMIASLRSSGADPRYTEITGGQHDITQIVYDSEPVLQWMLDPSGSHPTALSLSVPSTTEPVDDSPFVPALELEGAASVRLGNTMLDALAMSVPNLLPKNLLQGSLDDIYDATVVEGRHFNITFGGISYAADLWRVRFQAYRKDRLNVQIGVSNARLRIGGTSVIGRDHSAQTGPIDIVIGHRAPVWLSFDVTPYIADRSLKLKLVASRFDIPYDNWYVTYPAGVSVRGFGMTRDKVANGLVEGLYGNKARIEREVENIVPQLVKAIEDKLELQQANSLISSFWPLPVYSPRVRIWPQDVETDESGVSVVLGLSAAAVEPEATPEKPARRVVTPIKAADIPKSEDLGVAVAPNLLEGLTDLLIDADVARINVLDIPEATFAEFGDRNTLEQFFPELARLPSSVEVSTELHLADPIRIENQKVSDSDQLTFSVPGLLFRVEIRDRAADDRATWAPFAEIRYNVGQGTSISLNRIDDQTRALALDWQGETTVTASAAFSDRYQPSISTIDETLLTDLFRTCWHRWTGQGPASQTVVPDFDLGLTQLRLSEVAWKPPNLAITFSPPGVKLTNSSEVDLVYDTKGPFSDWGGPYTLKPGKSHDYPIAYPLIFRREFKGREIQYSLAPGSHSEFRVPRDGGAPRLFKAREGLDLDNIDAASIGKQDKTEAQDQGTARQ